MKCVPGFSCADFRLGYCSGGAATGAAAVSALREVTAGVGHGDQRTRSSATRTRPQGAGDARVESAMFMTCPRCFSADDVTYQRLPDRLVEYHCAGTHDGAGPHTWLSTLDKADWKQDVVEGVTDELLEPLLGCVNPGERFVEYG